jgi:hypothetical protein
VKRGELTTTFPALKILHFVRIYFCGIPILGMAFIVPSMVFGVATFSLWPPPTYFAYSSGMRTANILRRSSVE